MDRSADNLGQTISNIQRDLEELKSNQGTGGGGGGGGGEEYFAGNGIDIDQSNTISVDTNVIATKSDLSNKQDKLTAGSHISISDNNTISATGIPTKTSDLTNDGEDGSGSYVDSSELDKYYRSLVPFGTAISTQGTDLNTITYLSVGKYYCSGNIIAETLLNCPTDKAFMMEVFNPLTTDVDDETTRNWVYRTRLITTYEGRMYMQAANSSATAGVFTYGDWEEITQSGDLATVATTGDYDDLTNKPTIPAAQVNSDWNSTSGVSEILNKPTLATVATSGSYNDLTDKPTIPSGQIQSDWTQSDNTKVDYIKNKPSLATVATTGSYNDLTNKPTIPAAQIQSDWTQSDSAKVDFIKNKPTIDSALSDSSTNAVQNKVVTGKINEIDRYYRSLVPVGTAIASNKDLNTLEFLSVGKYYCSTNAVAQTLSNCPTTQAFMMEVFSPLSTTIDNESTGTWVYRLRMITTLGGEIYVSGCNSNSTAGNFSYSGWKKITNSADIASYNLFNVIEIEKSLTATTDWTDTGISGTDLDTGSYMVQVYTGSNYAGLWSERWTGVMSWFNGGTNSDEADEILLHNSGHASNGVDLFLRTKRNSYPGHLSLQYAFNTTSSTATTIKFSFRRYI